MTKLCGAKPHILTVYEALTVKFTLHEHAKETHQLRS